MKTILCALALVAFSHTASAQKEPTRDQVDQQLADFNETIAAARAVPEMHNGQRVGFKLVTDDGKELKGYQKVGFTDGETIRDVNIEAVNEDLPNSVGIKTVIGTVESNEEVSR